ncbi:MAG TPA: type II toxin-antitoxin system HicB family antitoxin [Tepidiformaceae bacterium]|jgi:predicted RNase H-like HicB family nuclease|nr:type II toxin-antitoxin system HicB family antitoxin [Tepidiformaceae bacterium]
MFSSYISSAMEHAIYEHLPEDGLFFGTIPGFDGVYATGTTRDACRLELTEVLEEWVLLGISLHHPLPVVDGVQLIVGQVA